MTNAMDPGNGDELLTLEQSWALLSGSHEGRFVFRRLGGYEVVPVTYDVVDRSLHFLIPAGRMLPPIDGAETITFEADGSDGASFWSVVIDGLPLLEEPTVPASLEGLHVRHVRFLPTRVTGRVRGVEPTELLHDIEER